MYILVYKVMYNICSYLPDLHLTLRAQSRSRFRAKKSVVFGRVLGWADGHHSGEGHHSCCNWGNLLG